MENHTDKKVSTFRERFAELCESDSKSATALANSLHVSKQTVSAWKNGTRSPRQPIIIDIANYFRVSVAWLMGYDVKKELTPHEAIEEGFKNLYDIYGYPESRKEYPQTKEAKIISAGIDKMSPERREQALKVLQTIFADYFDGGKEDET